ALSIRRKTSGMTGTSVEGFSLDSIGRAQLALKMVPEAVATLERAYALKPADDQVMAEISFALARALTAARKDPARARTLAMEARAGYQNLHDQRRVAEV